MERKNLWAPWRMKYIKQLSKPTDCCLCDYQKTPEKDAENHVLWRTENLIVTFNRFPYNNGHLLIAPARHVADLGEERRSLNADKVGRPECAVAVVDQQGHVSGHADDSGE